MLGALSNVGPKDGIARWTMYDPADGRVVWQREGGPHERRSSCVWDVNGDGCDDLVHSHFFDLIALDGKTGATLWYQGGRVPGYHLAAVADVDGSGKPSLLLSGGYMALYRFDLQGQEIWRTPPLDYNAGSAAAIGGTDGDGVAELGVAFTDRFACYNAATGQLKWSLPLPGKGSDVAAADVDGDGRMEFVFGCADGKLYAVGTAPETDLPSAAGISGRVLWHMDLGAPVGPPTVADVDGDGLAEILVSTSDGWLYALGAPKSRG
jgi:outer membrane protein assembly factor BamB